MTIKILNNLLYLSFGMLLGWSFGWSRNTIMEVKDVTKKLERKMRRDERGWYTHKLSLILVITFTAVAAIWTGIVNNKFQHSQECTETTFSKVITTLNERTSATTDVNIADTAQSVAFAKLISRLLDTKNPPSEVERRLLSQDYLNKLVTYNQAKAARDEAGDFPTKEEYKDCLEGN